MKTPWVSFFLITSLLIKLILAYFVPVFGDETYYYVWSLHPQLSYFDHPAMVAWFIRVGHFIFPAGNPLALRISFVIASFLVSLIWVKILKDRKLSDFAICSWLCLVFLNPLLGPGSILATPDVPLVLFWSLSFYCYLKIIEFKNLMWYALLGVSLGLGFCSKYHIVLFVLSGLLYLFFSKKFKTLKIQGVLITIIFGALFSAPVIIWNMQNNWSSFTFQIKHGFGESYFDWAWPVGYLVAQTLVINPFVLWSLFKKDPIFIDKTFSLTQLCFFLTSSFKGVVEGNWPLTSHLHSNAYFAGSREKKLFNFSIIYWLAFYGLLALFFIMPASHDVKRNLVNSTQIYNLLDVLDKYQPLYGPSYQMASLLSWKSQKSVPKLSGLSRHDFYDSLPESMPTMSSFYVLKYDISAWPENYVHYKKIKLQSFDNTRMALYHLINE